MSTSSDTYIILENGIGLTRQHFMPTTIYWQTLFDEVVDAAEKNKKIRLDGFTKTWIFWINLRKFRTWLK